MGEHAETRGIKLVFEATKHLEMGKFVNTSLHHRERAHGAQLRPLAEDGIACLKLAERVAEYQVSAEYPNGYAIPGAGW